MTDLSHWDFAQHFAGYDAAALILGLEPRESEHEQWRVNVVRDRMELSYQNAKSNVFHENLGDPRIKHPIEFPSVQLTALALNQFQIDSEETTLLDWINSRSASKFMNQEFDRDDIIRWLSAIGMQSLYCFDLQNIDAPARLGDRWPWGNHHTELLGHLEAAARRYWVNYEPTDATTAPINKDVSEWLIAERKVSKTMADSIASMLRPDGLPTGPRK
jgi:hypothetical protein